MTCITLIYRQNDCSGQLKLFWNNQHHPMPALKMPIFKKQTKTQPPPQINHLCQHCADSLLEKLVMHFMLSAQLVFLFVHGFTNLSLFRKMLNTTVKCITTLGLFISFLKSVKCEIKLPTYLMFFMIVIFYQKQKTSHYKMILAIYILTISQWKIPHRSTTTLNATENSVLCCPGKGLNSNS